MITTFVTTLASLLVTFGVLKDDDERALGLLLLVAPLSFVLGAIIGRKRQDLRFMRAAFLALLGAMLATAVFFPRFPEAGIASALYRSMLIAPMLATLAAVVGRAAAYLFFGSGRFDPAFGFELFIGVRYLRSLRGSMLSVVTIIALVGVVLGVGLMIVALGIMSGLEGDLTEKIIGANAHLVVSKYPGYVFEKAEASTVQRIGADSGAMRTTPFLSGEIFVVSDSNHTEGLLYGIDPETAPGVYQVFSKLERGNLNQLERQGQGTALLPPPTEIPLMRREEVVQDEDVDPEHRMRPIFPPKRSSADSTRFLPGIIIGAEMARQLHVDLDDALTVVSPQVDELTPDGPKPKTKAFRIAGVFELRMYEFDAHYVYTSLSEAQKLFEVGEDISGVAMAFADANVSESLTEKVLADCGGYPFQAMSWQARNKNLFLALKLEKAISFIVLIFIVLVASFSIVNTLTMAVIEKTREIAILKTMGAKDVSLAKVFLAQGALVGLAGTLMGALVGVALALVLSNMGIAIDPDVYYLDRLPIRLHAADIAQVCTLAVVLTTLSAIFPAVNAARLAPVDGLRYE